MAGLTENRRDICQLLWRLWSPDWAFDEATFERTAVSFDNPDFVDVVIQSYRHRYGYAPGDPALGRHRGTSSPPSLRSPCRRSTCTAAMTAWDRPRARRQCTGITGPYERRLLPRIGHNVPQEAPSDTIAALRDLMKGTTL